MWGRNWQDLGYQILIPATADVFQKSTGKRIIHEYSRHLFLSDNLLER